MGAQSTIKISRAAARQFLAQRIWSASDYALEVMMDEVMRERLYNVNIVANGEDNNDDLLGE